ncbi:hypothetical protein B5F22_00345 [Pseudoflavonifractor sp. An187]|nr:hypothetical protein B5F22_00345 [Pseudoflavonifractor sp. An187]
MLFYMKYAVLWMLVLVALCLCAVVVMLVMQILFRLQLDSVVGIGIQVGFTAWLLMSVYMVIRKTTRTKK